MRALAQDAAQRAASLLQGHAPQALDTLTDIVRFTTGASGATLHTAADHLGLPPLQMRHLTLAYEHGGPHGVSTHLTPHTTDPGTLADAEAAIQPLRPSPNAPVERHHNQLTDPPAGVQLRHGTDGRWYPYVDRYGTWQPAAAPHPDPAAAYRAARTARRQQR
ncbi:hypothetical protein ACIPPS_05855 [Streptomyces sp. NPDC090127]|uniref:hypothetical protein n=1 Tax=Streptomyces sp. NPDC090127 TaxID=3365953 RepID=UPI0038292A5D